MAPSYTAVLRTPHAGRTFGAALLGRLSYGTILLSLTFALTASTGSYTTAGALMAALGLTISVLSPLRARLIDRYGPRAALPPMAGAYALALLGLAACTWRPGAPVALLVALIAAAGASAPPLGPVMRTLWSDLVPGEALRRRAYSLDAVAEELLYITGPLLAGLATAVASPSLGVAASAVLVATGTVGLVTSPAVRPHPAGHRPGRGGRALQFAPVIAAAATGAALGCMDLLAVASARHHHHATGGAWVMAAMSAGSALGGLAYGAIGWRPSPRVRLAFLAAALGTTIAAAGLAPGVGVLAAAMFAAGAFVGPSLTTAYLLADADATPRDRVRAGAWVNTAVNLGSSAGTGAIGACLDALPLPACFAVAAAPAAVAALVLAAPRILRKRQRSSPDPVPGTSMAAETATTHPQGRMMSDDDGTTAEEFWDARYGESDRIWSGDPNTVLVREAADLPPGTALDLGAGEGADAVWLAGRGWRVTAVDISRVALERGARHAADAGVGDRVDWQHHDLAVSFPKGEFDLVSAHFLHSPREMPRAEILRSAAAAVAPGGTLLIVGHAGPPPWEQPDHEHAGGHDHHHDMHLPTPDEVLESLRLPQDAWEVQHSGEHERVQTAPDGETVTRMDNALKLRRLA
ncbi:MFS transporter [Actinomadura violacea]|uniref:MFS transporter n=1 Tax=Actinomadura violacea TaxID=2819934 RepID=A0ABS3RLU6_9ACTN|nr:MFS transporter [Actinomadura violacea]MBO2457059.1 MFS transporter [Actinomadura violacea]